MPRQPWSHPVMTWPTPALYVNGFWPGSLVDQNFLPLSTMEPVACRVTLEPFTTSFPGLPAVWVM
eukprot:CAMPEP_0183796556 /NCGR_PEP_ID=MMETSP0803_2-20130417/11521_1 /TAXON_ID=195967 /ORGANISM="Crustomastix stigmata, Strain CCMP3273" /LENGTH=64 /DNA_ID=CAMNT_0026041205 /DNA_START=186 /DNA_END=380 /DNA_ORIENTATION=-